MKLKIILSVFMVALGFCITYPFYNVITASAVGVAFGALAVVVLWGLEPRFGTLPTKSIIGGAIGAGVASLSFLAFKEMVEVFDIPSYVLPYIYLIGFITLFYLGSHHRIVMSNPCICASYSDAESPRLCLETRCRLDRPPLPHVDHPSSRPH